MSWTRISLLSVALVLLSQHARAQGEDAPAPIGPPRPAAPPPPEEEESRPLDATTPAPIPAPEPGPEEAPPPRFGAPGVFVITSGFSVGIGALHYAVTDASQFFVQVSPGLDYFILRHVSVGFALDLEYGVNRGYGADGSLVESTYTIAGAGPRIGADLPLGRFLSWYPRLTLSVESEHHDSHVVSGKSASVSGSPFGAPSTTQTGPTIQIFAPLLLHPVRHFFLGAGPSLFHEFGKAQGGPDVGGERTTLGGHFVLGTWWGGTADGPAHEAPPPTAKSASHEPRFGDAYQAVITGEAGAGAFFTSYAGSDSTTTTLSFSPGVDYFVSSGFSLGVGLSASYGKQTGLQPSGAKVTSEVTRVAGAARMGLNIPMASWASFYPRANLGAGVQSFIETSGNDSNNPKVTIVFIGLFAPVLFHFAPHAFFGVGPYVSHDLLRELAGNNSNGPDNLATSFGANVVIGGWL